MEFLSSVSHYAWFLVNATNVWYIRATKTRVTLLKVCSASDIDTPKKSATVENEHPCASLYRVKPNCCSGVVEKVFKFGGCFFMSSLIWSRTILNVSRVAPNLYLNSHSPQFRRPFSHHPESRVLSALLGFLQLICNRPNAVQATAVIACSIW